VLTIFDQRNVFIDMSSATSPIDIELAEKKVETDVKQQQQQQTETNAESTNSPRSISKRPPTLPVKEPKTVVETTRPEKYRPTLKKRASDLHKDSMRIESIRHKDRLKKKKELYSQLHSRSEGCWKRRFYCSDYCRIKTQFLISDTDSGIAGAIYGWSLIASILFSYFLAIMETFRVTNMDSAPLYDTGMLPSQYLHLQVVFVLIFAMDTLLRLLLADCWFFHGTLTAAQRSMDPHGTLSHIPFFLDLWNWIDIVSILSVFVIGFSASFFIVFRIFRPIRHISQFKIIAETLTSSCKLLSISTFFLFSLIVFFSFLVLGIESCYSNDCQFVDGFNSLYFVVITMTTVGFGDQIPTTVTAKAATGIAIIIGSFYLAMPLAIVGSRFDHAWEQHEAKRATKRSDAENKILEEIRERRLTAAERRHRVVVSSYQALDSIHSVAGSIQSFSKDERGSKIKLRQAYERLFHACGRMLDELLILFPNYAEKRPMFIVNSGNSSQSQASHRRGRSKKLKSMNASSSTSSPSNVMGEDDSSTSTESKESLSAPPRRSSHASSVSSESDIPLSSKIKFVQNLGLRSVSARASSPFVIQNHAMDLEEVVKSEQLAQIKRNDESLEGVSFLTKSVNKLTGEVHLVTLVGAHTPDGISLKGHYWESQINQREGHSVQHLQLQYRSLRFKRKGGTPLLQRCNDSRKNVIKCLCSSPHVSEENVAHKAKQGSWRAAGWLLLEAPQSSTAAICVRNFRLLLTFMALMLVFAETSPSFNEYGPNSKSCKATVNFYCNYISQCRDTDKSGDYGKCDNQWSEKAKSMTQADVNAVNVGCFPNATSGYKGCLGDMNGQYENCDFPNEALGMVMDPELFGASFIEELGRGDTSQLYMAQRKQCTEVTTSTQNYSQGFWVAELVFTIIFVLELISRLVVATAPDDLNWSDWFSDIGNYIDILAVATALIEIIGNSVDSQSSDYKVWGWMTNHSIDPGTFRSLRIVVAIRFMLQQRHFKVSLLFFFFLILLFLAEDLIYTRYLFSLIYLESFQDTQLITSTISQVASRLLVPLMLFGLLVTMFGSLLYFVEGGVMYDCINFDSPTPESCHYCGGPPFVVPFGRSSFESMWGEASTTDGVVWGDSYLGHPEWYNGTCRFLHEAAGGATSGVGAGNILQTPLIIDAFDGVWTIFIVMTTVGYGGKRPHTMQGKIVVICAAIVGAFYLAMPLSIIATAFDKNYQVHVEAQEKDKKRRDRHKLSFGSGKLKFMHIVKLKLWAKRSVARAQGHHQYSMPPSAQVIKYAKELHKLANEHNYTQLMEFKVMHKDLLEHCITIMARHMS